jgi:signal transduction histidine kinase
MSDAPLPAGGTSRRIAAAGERAEQRLRRQRDLLRPLGVAVALVVAAGAFGSAPHPGLHGRPLGLAVALVVFLTALGVSTRGGFVGRSAAFQAAVIVVMGAAGVAVAAFHPRGATGIAAAVAVWMALTRLPLPLGLAVGAATTVAIGVAAWRSGDSSGTVLAAVLVAALLGLIAYFLKQARAGQDRTELLLAELEDAREEQTRAAAVAERGRIAGELHDVLAHSLSGAAIQLQGARKLAEREDAAAELRAAIERAGELVKDGLANARQAVGALRGDEPGIAQLEALVASFRDDLDVDVTLRVEGVVRPVGVESSLALYRGAQEALTNVARYAPGAATTVVLRYGSGRTTLTIEDELAGRPAVGGLAGVGGGAGLEGMRARIERAGGTMHAGPTPSGWRVELEVPA